MVSPVTGPFSQNVNQEPRLNKVKSWYRQKKPYTLPLNYTLRYARVIKSVGDFESSASGAYNGALQWGSAPMAVSTNAAYERLKGQLGDSAELGTSLAEYRQAADMMGSRALQLVKLIKALRRFDLPAAATIIKRQVPSNKLKRGTKDFGNLWLEWSFGWSPLIDDIDTALDVLVSPGPLKRKISGSASSNVSYFTEDRTSLYYSYTRFTGTARCKQGCMIQVTNHNLFLAQQLGLTNPIATAWELVPYSFLVDHIVNVSQFLNSGTDFLGLAISGGYTTKQIKGTRTNYTSYPSLNYLAQSVYEVVTTDRVNSLTLPTLTVRPFRIASWKRAATYISLLAQHLKN